MVRVRDWASLSDTDAAAMAGRWWAGQAARLAWLDTQLGERGLRLAWTDDSLFKVWAWFVSWAAERRDLPVESAPEWFDWQSARTDPSRCGVGTAVAADALAHSLEAHLRATYPALRRRVGARASSTTEVEPAPRLETQNQPVLALSDGPATSVVLVGYAEAWRFASRAHHYAGSIGDCPLIMARDAAGHRYATGLATST